MPPNEDLLPTQVDIERPLPTTLAEAFSEDGDNGEAFLQILEQLIPNARRFPLQPDPEATPDNPGYATLIKQQIIFYNPYTIFTLPIDEKMACFAHEFGHHLPELLQFQDQCEALIPATISQLPAELPQQTKEQMARGFINTCADVILETIAPHAENVTTQDLLRQCFLLNRGTIFSKEMGCVSPEEREAGQKRAQEFKETQEFVWKDNEFEGAMDHIAFQNLFLTAPFFGMPETNTLPPKVVNEVPTMEHYFRSLRSTTSSVHEKCMVFFEGMQDLGRLLQEDIDEQCSKADDPRAKLKEIIEQIAQHNRQIEVVTQQSTTVKPGTKEGKQVVEANLQEAAKRIDDLLGTDADGSGKMSGKILDSHIQEMAEQLEIPPEIYRQYLQTCDIFSPQITRLTEVFTRFIQQEYRKMPVRRQRSGSMVEPGREAEAWTRGRMGEFDAPVYVNQRNFLTPKILQIQKIIDVSGSMGDQLNETLGYYTAFMQSALNIAEELRNKSGRYKLPRGMESPVQTEVILFHSGIKLVVPLDDAPTLKTLVQGFYQIILEMQNPGGTNSEASLKYGYSRMKLHDPNALKFISILSDGYDTLPEDTVLNQIQEDPLGIYFMVNGVAPCAQAVIEMYESHFRPHCRTRMHAAASHRVGEAVDKTITFLEENIDAFSSKS